MSKKKQPRVVLTIGFDQFLLPNDTGISTVIRTLSNARRVKGYYTSSSQSIEFEQTPLEISMQFLPESFKSVKHTPKVSPPPPPPESPEPEASAWVPPKDWRKSVEEICAEPDGSRRIVPTTSPVIDVEPVILHPVRVSGSSSPEPISALPAPTFFALPAPGDSERPQPQQQFLLE